MALIYISYIDRDLKILHICEEGNKLYLLEILQYPSHIYREYSEHCQYQTNGPDMVRKRTIGKNQNSIHSQVVLYNA